MSFVSNIGHVGQEYLLANPSRELSSISRFRVLELLAFCQFFEEEYQLEIDLYWSC